MVMIMIDFFRRLPCRKIAIVIVIVLVIVFGLPIDITTLIGV